MHVCNVLCVIRSGRYIVPFLLSVRWQLYFLLTFSHSLHFSVLSSFPFIILLDFATPAIIQMIACLFHSLQFLFLAFPMSLIHETTVSLRRELYGSSTARLVVCTSALLHNRWIFSRSFVFLFLLSPAPTRLAGQCPTQSYD